MKPNEIVEIVICIGIIVFVLIVSLSIGGNGVSHNDVSNQEVVPSTGIVTSNHKNNISDTSTAFQKTILHSFTGGNDGSLPNQLIQGSDGNFYGTTTEGGDPTLNDGHGYGTVFKITPQGQETVLYYFAGGNDGARPLEAGLIQGTDGNFYGTTSGGGVGGCRNLYGYGCGTVFKITPQGQETILYSFAGGTDGAGPHAGLIQGRDGNFYGTTYLDGANSLGTVFQVTPQGQETVLYNFAGGNDGARPSAGLIQGSDGNFYGTTDRGGDPTLNDGKGYGTVFQVTPQGQETVLYNFAGGNYGSYPYAGLIQGSDGNFYGTTNEGGSGSCKYSECGIVFKITPQGQETVLHIFAGGTDGYSPMDALIQGSDGNFYGTTADGGDPTLNNGIGYGTVFKITPQGKETILYRFAGGNDGVGGSELIRGSDGNFYGTTGLGGNGDCTYGCGTVFKLTPQ